MFLASIQFGTQTFSAVLDTGSSDTWLAAANFTCADPDDQSVQPQSTCGFGNLYDSSQSSTFQTIPNTNFNITYADGEVLNGAMGYESVTLAGITVPQQEIADVTYAAWYGDGVSSGLVGLAYPSLTSAYAGSNPDNDQAGQTVQYFPLFTNMYYNNLINATFCLALSRGEDYSNAGVLALGGIPNINVSSNFVSTPLQVVKMFTSSSIMVPPKSGSAAALTNDTVPQYQFYAIAVDGWSWVAAAGMAAPTPIPNNTTSVQAIVDSGTSLIYAPDDIAASVASAFDPPAIYSDQFGGYATLCTATPPKFGVYISGRIHFINAADMLIPADSNGNCVSGVQPAGTYGMVILGDVFMKNVLSVFDVGAGEMRFALRSVY